MATINKDWLSTSLAGRLAQAKNIAAKAPNYETELNLNAAWQTRMTLNADAYEVVFNSVAQLRATMKELGDWAENVYESKETDEEIPKPPVFQIITLPTGAKLGLDQTLRDFAEYVKVQPGYTKAIGLDLMVIKPDEDAENRDEISPAIGLRTLPNYTVVAEFAKQGMTAVQFEYQSKNSTVWQKFFAQKSPFSFQIAPAVNGQPESGIVRAIFMDGNISVGIYSPLFPVTLS